MPAQGGDFLGIFIELSRRKILLLLLLLDPVICPKCNIADLLRNTALKMLYIIFQRHEARMELKTLVSQTDNTTSVESEDTHQLLHRSCRCFIIKVWDSVASSLMGRGWSLRSSRVRDPMGMRGGWLADRTAAGEAGWKLAKPAGRPSIRGGPPGCSAAERQTLGGFQAQGSGKPR